MFQVEVMTLARLIGLSQAQIARELGLHREQVFRWSKGRSPVPRKHQETLLALVLSAAFAFLDAGKADQTYEPRASASDLAPAPPARRTIEQLISALTLHGLEMQGHGPTWILPQMIAAMQVYATMTEAELREPETAAQLEDQAGKIYLMSKVLRSLGPLPPREETEHASHQSTISCRSASMS